MRDIFLVFLPIFCLSSYLCRQQQRIGWVNKFLRVTMSSSHLLTLWRTSSHKQWLLFFLGWIYIDIWMVAQCKKFPVSVLWATFKLFFHLSSVPQLFRDTHTSMIRLSVLDGFARVLSNQRLIWEIKQIGVIFECLSEASNLKIKSRFETTLADSTKWIKTTEIPRSLGPMTGGNQKLI